MPKQIVADVNLLKQNNSEGGDLSDRINRISV